MMTSTDKKQKKRTAATAALQAAVPSNHENRPAKRSKVTTPAAKRGRRRKKKNTREKAEKKQRVAAAGDDGHRRGRRSEPPAAEDAAHSKGHHGGKQLVSSRLQAREELTREGLRVLKEADRALRRRSGIHELRLQAANKQLGAGAGRHEQQADAILGQLHLGWTCYVCKKRYDQLHFFYDQLCPWCSALNYAKRYVLPPTTLVM
jgi:hypothetical protein